MGGNDFALAMQCGYKQGYEDGAIEELEKIKRKLILKLSERFDFGIETALNVIDEELSKLKGENK